MFKKFLLPFLLLSATSVCAQQPTHGSASKAPAADASPNEQQVQEQVARQNQQILQAALQVTRLIDQNKTGDVWDGASDVAKKASSKDAFVKQISADRKVLGVVKLRTAKAVNHTQSKGSSIPAGLYASVVFSTQFANEHQPVRELVSFHFDADRTWRVSGYTVR